MDLSPSKLGWVRLALPINVYQKMSQNGTARRNDIRRFLVVIEYKYDERFSVLDPTS